MNIDKDEYSSHMTNISEAGLDFFSKSGVSGWPTILGIFGIMVMVPEAYKWLDKSKIDKLPKPEIGDDVHWYKIKYDLKSNIKRSVPISLLKGLNTFTSKDIPEPINSSVKLFTSTNCVYFLGQNVKVCSKSETDLKNCKDLIINGELKDVLSKDNFDYILTSTNVYKLNTSDYSILSILDNKGTLNAFCLANDVIIVASSIGGWRIALDNSVKQIERKENTTQVIVQPSQDDDQSTQDPSSETGPSYITVQYSNGVPEGECTYCWFDGSKYYIGDYITSGNFTPEDVEFEAIYVEGNDDDIHPSFLTSGVNRHNNNLQYAERENGLLYNTTNYNITKVKSILELNDYILFGTESGIKVFSKLTPDKEFISLSGINESVNGLCLLYGTVFVIGQNKKYRTFDSEEDDNKLRFIVLGTDYDIDIEADETDAKEVKLTLLDLLDMALDNSKVFDSKLSKANSRAAKYAIAIYDSKPKVINLYGHDNRNAFAVETNNCMKSFDVEIK